MLQAKASSSLLACPAKVGKHVRKSAVTSCAATVHVRASTVSRQVAHTRGAERLLRYPDGRVRCIRYPTISAESEIQPDQFDVTISYEEDWDSDHWDDIDWAWDVTSQWDRPSTVKMPSIDHAVQQPNSSPPAKVQLSCSQNSNLQLAQLGVKQPWSSFVTGTAYIHKSCRPPTYTKL